MTATVLVLVALWIGPKFWKLSALWVYLVAVTGMCLGVLIMQHPTPEQAGRLECIRALLAALIGLEIGRQAARASSLNRLRWSTCCFEILCYVGCAWTLGYIALNYLSTTTTRWGYRGVAMVDLAAASVLLTVWARMHITRDVDRLTVQLLGYVYILQCAHRLMWQMGEMHAAFFGWAATLTYLLAMLLIGLAALDEWYER